jgi:hypothetical protein
VGNKLIPWIVGMSVAGITVNAPLVRSRLKSPIVRAVVAGLLAAVTFLAGVLIQRLVFQMR